MTDPLNTSQPLRFDDVPQPYADPYQVGPVTFAKQRPNWGGPFVAPPIPAFACNCASADCWRNGCAIRRRAVEKQANRRAMVLRADDV